MTTGTQAAGVPPVVPASRAGRIPGRAASPGAAGSGAVDPAGTAPVPGRRALAGLAFATVATFLAAFLVLSSTINWPESLGLAAGEALPLVVAERAGLLLGYGLYLAYSLAILPLAVLLPRALGLRPGPLVTLGIAVGVASSVLRALGIARWLTAMPVIADVYATAPPDSATREAAALTYTALNEYAGGLGEVLGVGLAGGMWLLLLSASLLRSGGLRWLAVFGAVTGLATLAGLVSDAVATVATTILLAFLVTLAVRLLGLARAADDRAQPAESAEPAEPAESTEATESARSTQSAESAEPTGAAR